MSFIQFESGREKEKARNELRQAREEMLDKAKRIAEQRAEREATKHLKGEINWILPSVEAKLLKQGTKKLKKKKDKKRSKKSKKKSSKKRKYSSSEDESDSSQSSSTADTDSSSSEDHKRHKQSTKPKKKHKSKKKYSRDNSDLGTDTKKDEWVEVKKSETPLQRDSWMTDSLMLKTYSRQRPDSKTNEKQQIETYDPAKSSRELNPHWKTTGTGLPAFRKPRDEDDHSTKTEKPSISYAISSSKNWKKQNDDKKSPLNESKPPTRNKSASSDDESSSNESDVVDIEKEKPNVVTAEFLTDQQMNELGAKILKAEIMGNMSVAEELRKKLENARIQRNIFKDRKKTACLDGSSRHNDKNSKTSSKKEEHILLTHTDQSGQTRPLASSKTVDPRDMYGGKKKQKRVKTHDDSGQRVRYFADDDRYDIKQMFEREKYTTASESNLQFADIAGKHKNPNDDLEDIFAEKVCQDDSARSNRKNHDRAINEHQKMEAALDNCEKCFDSKKMQKELLVSVGENVYLSLPWYQGLQPGHCMIIPSQHSTCCTQLDEDTWEEVNDFRKALTRMFAAQRKDVIFFEIANRLYKRPHLVIHCIPIKESEGEMAPFYFKKAIEESEHEWCVNKQLVSLRNKSLRSSIPKGLPYFWVNFGMDTGFAHVIEEQERFPVNFAQEIIGGMLNLDANKWRRLQKEQNSITKVKLFADWWKKYDCTK